jgi:tRNA threonylcarbamoyladenosine biosynthesis protein TsaB
MLILGVDTSGKNGSLALVDCTDEACRTLELVPLQRGTFSAQLVPQLAALLQKHGLAKQDLYGFAVVSGPGSFTGLRVGLAAVKALADILQKDIAAVSLLEAVAIAAGVKGRILAALDAGRAEVYCAEYDVVGWYATTEMQQVMTDEEFVRLAHTLTVITPDERVLGLLNPSDDSVKQILRPTADFIAQIGFEKMEKGETVSPEALDATYIRRSEAEIKFAERTR